MTEEKTVKQQDIVSFKKIFVIVLYASVSCAIIGAAGWGFYMVTRA